MTGTRLRGRLTQKSGVKACFATSETRCLSAGFPLYSRAQWSPRGRRLGQADRPLGQALRHSEGALTSRFPIFDCPSSATSPAAVEDVYLAYGVDLRHLLHKRGIQQESTSGYLMMSELTEEGEQGPVFFPERICQENPSHVGDWILRMNSSLPSFM